MSLGIFLWIVLIMVLNSDTTELIMFGVLIVIAVICGILVAYFEK